MNMHNIICTFPDHSITERGYVFSSRTSLHKFFLSHNEIQEDIVPECLKKFEIRLIEAIGSETNATLSLPPSLNVNVYDDDGRCLARLPRQVYFLLIN